MPTFSISLPSLRPQMLVDTVRAIHAASAGHDYEILAVCPFGIEGTRLVHVPEAAPRGNCAAHALAWEASRGDIIVAFSDDHRPEPGWLDPLAAAVATGEAEAFPFAGGLGRSGVPWFGTVYGLYYPYFPVMSRRSVEAIGGWFSPAYVAHFGDPDIGMRVWRAGGRCALIAAARIVPQPVSAEQDAAVPFKSKSFPADMTTFLKTYHRDHGAGFPPDMGQINHDYDLKHLKDGTFTERCAPRDYYARGAAGA